MNKANLKELSLWMLLIVAIILFTTYFKYSSYPDHYILGQYTYTIIDKGYSSWVLHPLSLFGYYPLSIPSGFEYFFAVLHSLTNLDLSALFNFFSIFSAIFAVIGTYLVMREFSSFETSFLSAIILATMVYFVRNVSNTASARMFNIVFYPLFILIVFKIFKHYKENKKISFKHIITAVLLFVLMNLIHRFGQLLAIFLIAFFASFLIANLGNIFSWFQGTKIYRFRKNFYEFSTLLIYVDLEVVSLILLTFFFIKINLIWINLAFIILLHYFWFDYFQVLHKNRDESAIFYDMLIFLAYAIIAKIIDLIARGRLLVNLVNLLEKYSFQLVIISVLLAVVLVVVFFIIVKKFKNLGSFYNFFRIRSIQILKNYPSNIFSWFLLLVMFFLFSRNFTGDNFYRFGFSHYTDSFLLKGTSPWVILFNFILNLNNNVTILIYFAGIGAVYFFFKNNKTFYDYFFIFVALGFSQFLLDWEYVRLYILPVYAIFIAVGLAFVIGKASKLINKKILYISLVLLLAAHFAIANVFIQREYILPKFGIPNEEKTLPEKYFIAAGQYLSDKGDYSVHTSSSIDYDAKTAYYARKIISVLGQSITPWSDFRVEEITFDEIWTKFKNGEKITDIYRLEDPIYGGYYYFARHIYNLNKRMIGETTVDRIIALYKIRYVVDSPRDEGKNEFFQSLEPLKNRIYSSGELEIYDISSGR